MRVLITGIAGFAGSWLAEALVAPGANARSGDAALPLPEPVEVHGVIHRHDRRIYHLAHLLTLHQGDLRNALWASELVEQVSPDMIFHLAAWSDVGGSWRQPWTVYELNIQCQLNLLEGVRRRRPQARTLIVTSNEAYGLVRPDELPILEETPFRPNSPYGVSKVTQDFMAQQYWQSHGLPTIRARAFNHIGPGQSDDFAASAFARQIADIEAGRREAVVRVGNLDAERDFSDVRDVVRAYWLLALHGVAGEAYNVGSGIARPVRRLLEMLLGMADVPVTVETDPARMRPSDVPRSVSDTSKLRAATGWQPQIDLRDSLQDMLDVWRQAPA